MARTIPSTYPYPDPLKFSAGLPVLASDWEDVGQHQNLGFASGRAQTVYQQGWTDDVFTHTGAAPATPHVRIRIPKLSDDHTTVNVWAYMEYSGGGSGTLKFSSTNGAANTVVIAPGAVAWAPNHLAGPSTLAVSFVSDVEEITIEASTSGGGAILIHDIHIEYDDLSSLAVPGASEPFIPLDYDELAADAPLTSDLGVTLIDNLEELEQRPRVYTNWSGLAGIVHAGKDPINMGDLQARYYRIWTPVHPGTQEDDDYDLNVHLYGGNVAGDRTYRIQHGHGDVFDDRHGAYSTDITITSASTPKWQTGTIRMSETYDLPGDPGSPFPFSHIDIDGPQTLHYDDLSGFAVWGR